jgi:hypothetical protein
VERISAFSHLRERTGQVQFAQTGSQEEIVQSDSGEMNRWLLFDRVVCKRSVVMKEGRDIFLHKRFPFYRHHFFPLQSNIAKRGSSDSSGVFTGERECVQLDLSACQLFAKMLWQSFHTNRFRRNKLHYSHFLRKMGRGKRGAHRQPPVRVREFVRSGH